MKVCLSKWSWFNKNNIWVTGFISSDDRYLINNELLDYFKGVDTIIKFEQILKSANGQFSVIIKTSDEIWAATDRLRNYPLFFTNHDGEYTISDDCYKLAELQSEVKFNSRAVNCFLSAGYVINNLTLINDIYQVEAGEYVILGYTFSSNFYYSTIRGEKIEKDFETEADELKILIHSVFKKHLKSLKNKFIAIPLSGGFDSRLIAAMCAEYHPDNLICYTYGTNGNPELAPAKEIAMRLGLKWINIKYDSGLIRDFLYDKIFNDYYPYASNLSSMFFLQEYFAVKYLKENKFIPDNCVFIPGFSGDMLAGGHLAPEMKNKMDKEKIGRLIFKQFFQLIGLDSYKKFDIIKLLVDNILPVENESWKVIEHWDIKEKQAKFIVNSAKVFTFFGYDYVLPLFDNLLIDFFSNLQFQYKLDKKLYDHVLTEYIFKDLNLNLPNEINPLSSQKAFQRGKEKIKKFVPYNLKNLFIQHYSPICYDEITKVMIEDLGRDRIINPRQSNYYNSYITQWYLFKTSSLFNIKESIE